MRIVARKNDDGRIEVALQQRRTDNTWTDRQLPARRHFPTTATTGAWLNSSPLTLNTPEQTFTAITAGQDHTCGLRSNGTATCWGSNKRWQATPLTGPFAAITAGN